MSLSSDMQSKLEALRPVYEKAQARINGTDQEWIVRKEMLMNDTFSAIKSFQETDPPSKAVFIIGRVQANVKELDAPRFIVLDYENKRKRYAEACIAENKTATQF